MSAEDTATSRRAAINSNAARPPASQQMLVNDIARIFFLRNAGVSHA